MHLRQWHKPDYTGLLSGDTQLSGYFGNLQSPAFLTTHLLAPVFLKMPETNQGKRIKIFGDLGEVQRW